MDYSDSFKYFFMRFLLLFMTDLFGVFIGKGIYWVIASVLPPSLGSLKLFLLDDKVGSITAALVMIFCLGLVFHDDGKKHAAYEDMDMLTVLITEILLLMLYFIPVIFYNPNDITKMWESIYYLFYFPCRWLIEFFSVDIKVSVALGVGIILAVQFVLYMQSYLRYKKKHPFSFKISEGNDDEDTVITAE